MIARIKMLFRIIATFIAFGAVTAVTEDISVTTGAPQGSSGPQRITSKNNKRRK